MGKVLINMNYSVIINIKIQYYEDFCRFMFKIIENRN